jgi:small multidrug resistance pump
MKWILLSLAILFEVVGTTLMKLSDGMTRPLPSALMIASYLLSLAFLSFAVKHFEVGVVYAVWSGVGIALITLIGILYFGERADLMKFVCLSLILIGVVGLNLRNLH